MTGKALPPKLSAKQPTRYMKVDPWAIIEKGFDPARCRYSESVFSLANEYMGVRGYFEEGFSGGGLLGSYFNGLFEEMEIQHPQSFKGFATRRAFNVNSVDWLHTRVRLDGEQLDLAVSKISDFERRLDMKEGTLTRTFLWHIAEKRIRVTFTRFLSIVDRNLACQRLTLEPLNFSGEVRVLSGLDFSPVHEIASGWTQAKESGAVAGGGKNFWQCRKRGQDGDIIAILGQTEGTGQCVFSSLRLASHSPLGDPVLEEEKLICLDSSIELIEGKAASLDRIVVNLVDRAAEHDAEKVWTDGMELARLHSETTFDSALEAHRDKWSEIWDRMDIQIEGDPKNQQGVRFSLFQMYQTYHGGDPSLNIPCKGLTAEVYYGWIFWDSETYCIPMYVFIDPKIARSLLEYRYLNLPQALERARELDCRGARFPFATADGTECCGTWQHGDLEVHIDLAISYAIWLYDNLCADKDFLYGQGIEMLLQICRYFASRGEWGARTGQFGVWGVMGPDEFHMMVNNNCYTNYMLKKTLEFSLEVIAEMKREAPERLREIIGKVALDKSEPAQWRRMADGMRIPRDEKTGILEQHDGFFDLPHVDIDAIPPEQIPIYKSWVYEKIFRYDMIKQPDTLLLFLFYGRHFTLEEKLANYEYYESRCIHESSLSPGIHSILACELGKRDQAFQLFQYMARLDLDDYNRNSSQGLHTTAMSGVWLNVVNGFAGLRTDGDILSLRPSLPDQWNSYSFKLAYRESLLKIDVGRSAATFKVIEGSEVTVEVYGEKRRIGAEGLSIALR